MKNYISSTIFFFLLLFLCGCESATIPTEGKLKIKNMDTGTDTTTIKHIKIIYSNSEKTVIDTDIQIYPGIIKTFSLEANKYIVHVSTDNDKEGRCTCLINSGETTYLQWEKRKETDNFYILYEVNKF